MDNNLIKQVKTSLKSIIDSKNRIKFNHELIRKGRIFCDYLLHKFYSVTSADIKYHYFNNECLIYNECIELFIQTNDEYGHNSIFIRLINSWSTSKLTLEFGEYRYDESLDEDVVSNSLKYMGNEILKFINS